MPDIAHMFWIRPDGVVTQVEHSSTSNLGGMMSAYPVVTLKYRRPFQAAHMHLHSYVVVTVCVGR